MANAYAEAVAALGHDAIVRDLYQLDFDPRLKLAELPTRPGWSAAPDVAAERELLADADVFAFFYPLWFNAPPSIIKGYIERVFGLGFGYDELRNGGQTPLLIGRDLIHISASGSTNAWLNEQGAWSSMRNLFDDYFGRVCGMRVRQHIHFDSIVPGLEERWIKTTLHALDTKITQIFGQPS